MRQISIALDRPTRSTSGLVPVRSGTSPSAGSFMHELGVVGEDPQVAGERKLEPGTDRVALNGRDGDDVGTAQPQETLLGPCQPLLEGRSVEHCRGRERALTGNPLRE